MRPTRARTQQPQANIAAKKMRSGQRLSRVDTSGPERAVAPAAIPDLTRGCGPGRGGAPKARLAIIAKLADSCYSSVKIALCPCRSNLLLRLPREAASGCDFQYKG